MVDKYQNVQYFGSRWSRLNSDNYDVTLCKAHGFLSQSVLMQKSDPTLYFLHLQQLPVSVFGCFVASSVQLLTVLTCVPLPVCVNCSTLVLSDRINHSKWIWLWLILMFRTKQRAAKNQNRQTSSSVWVAEGGRGAAEWTWQPRGDVGATVHRITWNSPSWCVIENGPRQMMMVIDTPGDMQNTAVQTPLATPEQLAGPILTRQTPWLHRWLFCQTLSTAWQAITSNGLVCLAAAAAVQGHCLPRCGWTSPALSDSSPKRQMNEPRKLSLSCYRSVSEFTAEFMMWRLCNLWCHWSNMWYGSIWRDDKDGNKEAKCWVSCWLCSCLTQGAELKT